MVALTVLCILRRDPVLQISHTPTQGNIIHVNQTNGFATPLMVTINMHCNINMPTMKIPQNSDKFVRVAE